MGKSIAWFLRFSWKDALLSALPVALLVVAGVWAALHFIDPAPRMQVVIATGGEDSEYLDFAHSYAKQLALDGVTLDVQSTGGAMDNIKQATTQNAEGARQLSAAAHNLQQVGLRLKALVDADG